VLQSVACNALHPIEARCCRWLLTTQDRVGTNEVPLTQEALAEMLGVQRTTVTAVAGALQERGLIRSARGRIVILDRARLKRAACECYDAVERHFACVLPEVKPQKLIDRDAEPGASK
jgi:Mn-dependent DtxR family transcriptional regulator